MTKVKFYYDEIGKTLSVWFDDPKKEVISEEAGEGLILNKDKKGNVIGFEKLFTELPKYKGKTQLPFELSNPITEIAFPR
jgi:uncharacterized protein YuzE